MLTALPIPHVHYAPLTVKGVTTSTPVDGASRKKQRLEAVRSKRVEKKERKRDERVRTMKKLGLNLEGTSPKFRAEQRRKKP